MHAGGSDLIDTFPPFKERRKSACSFLQPSGIAGKLFWSAVGDSSASTVGAGPRGSP